MGFERLLVIDASLSTRLAAELRNRGRQSRSLADVGDKQAQDTDLLRFLHDEYPDAVLVTADDHIPSDHSETVATYSSTLAIVDPLIKAPYNPEADVEEWRREIVHRWAHRMQELAAGQIRRCSLNRSDRWNQPRRIPIAQQTPELAQAKSPDAAPPIALPVARDAADSEWIQGTFELHTEDSQEKT